MKGEGRLSDCDVYPLIERIVQSLNLQYSDGLSDIDSVNEPFEESAKSLNRCADISDSDKLCVVQI